MTHPAITITRHARGSEGEYVAHVEGHAATGRLAWTQRGEARAAEHTLVPPEIGGMGVAARLVEALVEDARAEHFRVIPECSYVAAAFARHPDWESLLG